MNTNTQFMKFVGYSDSFMPNIQTLFSIPTMKYIQREIYKRSKVYFPQGVLVPCENISSVLDSVYSNFSPPTGCIYSRYIIPTNDVAVNSYATDIIDQTIRIILDDVVNTLGIEQNNMSLDVWDSVLGDFNRAGLRSHSEIKIRDNKPPSGLFFENY